MKKEEKQGGARTSLSGDSEEKFQRTMHLPSYRSTSSVMKSRDRIIEESGASF